ncbi:MAG: hypothetical protein FWE18_00080 [Alphaproteobacteria bacterium]|nr:hypothetical protein [Alphaproteobacteria bacterium]
MEDFDYKIRVELDFKNLNDDNRQTLTISGNAEDIKGILLKRIDNFKICCINDKNSMQENIE